MPFKDPEKRREYRRKYERSRERRRSSRVGESKLLTESQKASRAAYARKWRQGGDKTLKGHLVRRYNGMRCRVSGGLARSSLKTRGYPHGHRYEGLPILDRQEFYEWALSNHDYLRIHSAWVESGHRLGLCPTVDRVDNSKGYVLSNMRWLTFKENSDLGRLSNTRGRSKYRGVHYDLGCWRKDGTRTVLRRPWLATITQETKIVRIGSFSNEEEAARAYDRWARMIYGRAINFPD